MCIQGWFPLGLTCLISLLSKDSQECFPAPQFNSINSLVVSLLYGPVLTSIHDCWKNHSFDYIDLCRQSNVSPFKMLSRFVIAFLLFKSVFLKGVSVFYFHDCSHPHSDFAAPKNKVSHCFHCFSIYLPWSDGTGCHELHFF